MKSMPSGASRFLVTAFLLCFCTIASEAQENPDGQVLVAASICPPFVMEENGGLGGLALQLWDDIAKEIGVSYKVIEVPILDMLAALKVDLGERTFDLGISCLTVTAERERYVDFSHSYYETYIGVAVKEAGLLENVINVLTNPVTLRALGIFAGVAALLGVVFFLLERGTHEKLFTMKGRMGRFVEAFLVGSVFITRGPINFWEFKSLGSRIIATLLAIVSTFIIAAFTAVLASLFTLETLRSQIRSLGDLEHVSVASVKMSTSSEYLEDHGIVHRSLENFEVLVQALDQGAVDAIVADEAYLKYSIRAGKEQGKFEQLRVLPLEFSEQNYGFALPQGSALLEEFNLALLEIRTRPEWEARLNRYFGE